MTQPYEPANELEALFIRAATDASVRPEFYQKLVESPLFVLTPKPVGEGQQVIGPGDRLEIVHWSNEQHSIIPIFTSLERMKDALANAGGEPLGYVGIEGRDLFSMLSTGELNGMLNPNTPLGKELLREEMKALAQGAPEAAEQQQPRQITLGRPAEYPHKLTDHLRTRLEKEPEVEAAYLALMQEAEGANPMLMIALRMEAGDPGPLFQRTGGAASEILGEGYPITFVALMPGVETGLEPYFKQDVPFYRRPVITDAEESPEPTPEQESAPEPSVSSDPSDPSSLEEKSSPEDKPGWLGKIRKQIGL